MAQFNQRFLERTLRQVSGFSRDYFHASEQRRAEVDFDWASEPNLDDVDRDEHAAKVARAYLACG
jgi:hypothetical protein